MYDYYFDIYNRSITYYIIVSQLNTTINYYLTKYNYYISIFSTLFIILIYKLKIIENSYINFKIIYFNFKNKLNVYEFA